MSQTMTQMDTEPAKVPAKNGGDRQEELWTYDLFGCFGDWRLCLATFCCPCYTLGKNAQYLGDDGPVAALLFFIGFIGFAPVNRWRTRQLKNIRGTVVSDVVLTAVCPCCTLIQENRELYGMRGSHIGEQVPLRVEMERK